MSPSFSLISSNIFPCILLSDLRQEFVAHWDVVRRIAYCPLYCQSRSVFSYSPWDVQWYVRYNSVTHTCSRNLSSRSLVLRRLKKDLADLFLELSHNIFHHSHVGHDLRIHEKVTHLQASTDSVILLNINSSTFINKSFAKYHWTLSFPRSVPDRRDDLLVLHRLVVSAMICILILREEIDSEVEDLSRS